MPKPGRRASGRVVDLTAAVAERGRAHHRAHFRGGGVEHDEARLTQAAAAQLRDLLGDAPLEDALELEVEGGVQRAAGATDLGGELRGHPAHEVGRAVRRVVRRDGDRLGAELARGRGGQHATLDQQLDHVIAAAQRAREIAERIVRGRCARDHREQERLAIRQRGRRLPEVAAGGGVDAGGSPS